MGLVIGYALLLPAVTVGGWILSWRGEWWIRWCLLIVATVVSVYCVIHGFGTMQPLPNATNPYVCCRTSDDSGSSPLFWIAAGVIGFVCCLVLTFVTIVTEIVRYAGRTGSA